MLPVPMIEVEDQAYIEREIQHEPYIFNSTSYDQGLDVNFTYIENITWTYRDPFDVAKVTYQEEYYSIAFTDLGNHSLSLFVRDPAGNSDEMTLIIRVYDNSSPVISIDGGLNVSEDTTVTYELNLSDNDPRIRLREYFSMKWSFWGPYGFLQNHTSEIVRLVFPEPGTYYVWAEVNDGGNNTSNITLEIHVSDTTPPAGNIIGNPDVILGIPETYTANLTDNGRPMKEGSSYHWSLQYLEGPPNEWWTKNFTGISFEYNYTEIGTYTLILTANDPSGNERIFQININADGDLTPPWVDSILPVPDDSYQYSETMHFIVRFSEIMERASLTSDSIYLQAPNGSKVPVSYEIRDTGGRTEVTLNPGILNFSTEYTVVVEPTVQDTWENGMELRFTANYTVRTEFKLVHPWGPSHHEFFSNITNETRIILTFSNPVEASSMQRWISIRALGWERDLYTGQDRQTRTLISKIVTQGDDNFTIVIDADMDQGITYNLTIAQEATDVFNYNLDQSYMWDFTTYIPPTTIMDDDDDDDSSDIPEWVNNPIWWILAVVVLVFLLILLVIFAAIRRRRNLKKIWEAQQAVQTRKKPRGTVVVEEEPETQEPEEEEDIPSPTLSYEDLYGVSPTPLEPTPSDIYGAEFGAPAGPAATGGEPSGSKEIEWDEDDQPEEWDEEEEEEWEEDWEGEWDDEDDDEVDW
jgi:hypothetical protein